jgi:outer membrane protein OmpA-like peptidoglycan-associated protein
MKHPSNPAGRIDLGLYASLLCCAGVLAACSTTPKSVSVARPAAPAIVCTDFNFPIYFEKGSDQLDADAQQEIRYAAARVKGCKLGATEVLGLADADGAAHRNLVLSRKRAVVVAEALATYGLPAPSFDIEAFGKSGSVTPNGEPEPLRRRTEVVIRASPPTPSSPQP